MNKTVKKQYQRMRRHNRIRAKVSGTSDCPRLSVFRSARYISAQLIDDEHGVTILSATDQKVKFGTKLSRASAIGEEIAKKAKEKGIARAVFDRGGFLYAGRVKALADSARKGGLTF